jgi:hypothetical protein
MLFLPSGPTDWRVSSLCRGRSGWFSTDPFAQAVARQVCIRCPSRRPCALEALAAIEHGNALVGTWAGVTLDALPRRLALKELRAVSGNIWGNKRPHTACSCLVSHVRPHRP